MAMKASKRRGAEVRNGSVDIAGQRLHVAIRPGSNGGTPLLLCNGLGANLELLYPFVDALDGVETVIFDVPGTGRSAAPNVPYRFGALAWLAEQLVDKLGYGEFDVLGVSWGGVLAQQLAAQYPNRCRRMILAATAAGSFYIPGELAAMAALANPQRYYEPEHMAKIAPVAYGGVFRKDPQLALEYFREATQPSFLGYIAQMMAGVGWTSIFWLHWLRQRTLVMSGNDDPLVPLINAQVLATSIPHARLEVFDDGHLFLLTSAGKVAPVVSEFLAAA
jgi:poly(3-hydroxyalkanoate) depolymerase